MKLPLAALTLTLAITGLFSATSVASATSQNVAIASVSLNVRAGPSTRFTAIDTLYPGEVVQTRTCQSGWCYITHSGPDGWVAARYLTTRTPTRTTIHSPRTLVNPRIIGAQWPYMTRNISHWPFGGWSAPAIPWPFQGWPFAGATQPVVPLSAPIPTEPEYEACFYAGNHYSGQDICVLSGRSFEELGPRWNNKISSIRVFPGAQVTVCDDQDYQGYCRTINQDVFSLSQQLRARISSLRVD